MKKALYVDHHIQENIVNKLFVGGSQTFSKLRPADVENSLFMYHLRKLLSRGIVEKSPTGFALTKAGAHWVNQLGPSLESGPLPRARIQLVVVKDDSVLIQQRVGHHAEHLNRYMLPGTLHHFGETSKEAAERIASNYGLKIIGECIGRTELIRTSRNVHTITDLYEAIAPKPANLYKDSLIALDFMPIRSVLGFTREEANALPDIIKLYLSGKLGNDIFRFD